MTLALLFSHAALDDLLGTWGYAAVFAFIAIESLGIPFPGETMLVAAALYAGATHNLVIGLVVLAAAAGAIVGDNIGFALGRWGGYRLLRRYGRYLRLDERRLLIGRWLFVRHGGKVVFLGRFVSVLRTYAAFLAGTNRMTWGRFLAFNAAGGIVWAAIYGFGYYYFASVLRRLSTPVDVALGAIAAASVVALIWYARRNEERLAERALRDLPDGLRDEPPSEG